MKRRGPAEGTQKSWLEKRREEVARAVGDGQMMSDILAVDTDDFWTEGHEGEAGFQANKERKRKMESYQDGLLLEKEIDADESIQDDLKTLQETVAKNDAKLVKHRKLQDQRPLHGRSLSLAGKACFVSTDIDRNEAGRLLMEANAHMVEDRKNANVYLVKDALNPGQRTTWYAILGGRPIVELAALSKGNGMIITFDAHKVSTEVIHLNGDFKASHPEIASAVMNTCQTGRVKDAKYKLCISSQGRKGNGWYTKSTFLQLLQKSEKQSHGVGKICLN